MRQDKCECVFRQKWLELKAQMKHIQRETFDIERIVMVVVVLAVVIRVEQSGVGRDSHSRLSSVVYP